MKTLIVLLALFAGVQQASAAPFLYRCDFSYTSFMNGYTQLFRFLQVDGTKVSYWFSPDDYQKDKIVEVSDLSKQNPGVVSFGTITSTDANGNAVVTGKELFSPFEPMTTDILYRELSVYRSLTLGAKYGRFSIITHVKDGRSKTKELEPRYETGKCTLYVK